MSVGADLVGRRVEWGVVGVVEEVVAAAAAVGGVGGRREGGGRLEWRGCMGLDWIGWDWNIDLI